MAYWLMKSEPEAFSIDDLRSSPGKKTHWDGVRNYQARNFMRQMQKGDLVLFYHSNTKPPGIVGIAEVVRLAYPDFTAWDANDSHYDPKSTADNPRWDMVDIRYKQKFSRMITLDELRDRQGELDGFPLLRKGNRLSVMPVSAKEWNFICSMQ